MEQPRLSAGRDARDIIKEEKEKTLVLPIAHHRGRRPSVFKMAFYLFLLIFFAFCVWLVVDRLFGEGDVAVSTLFDTLVRQGICVPK